MAAFVFTDQQREALEFGGNVAVSAGAGSGKTRVLVEKYFRLLADEKPRWPVDSVVAITFTVKAASELKSRIVHRITGELDDPDLPDSRRARLTELRRELPDAPIGTIHNFCSRILREYAFDARISPDFEIVEGIHESSLRREAALAALSDASSDPGSRAFCELLILQTLHSRASILGMLESLLQRRTEFLPAARRFREIPADDLFKELERFHCQVVTPRRREAAIGLHQALLEFIGQIGGSASEIAQAAVSAVSDVAHSDSWNLAVAAADHVLEPKRLFTQKGLLLKKLADDAGVPQDDLVAAGLWDAAMRTRAKSLADLGMADRENLAISAMMANLLLNAVGKYEQLRSPSASAAEDDLLDFADLELLAERLITGNPHVREELRKRFNYLILDEFQDTSESQWRILKPLVCDERGEMLPARFFMVGDPKQGVYGFRQASANLFRSVSDLVIASNPTDLIRTGTGEVSMTYNFRTLETPLTAINSLFSVMITRDDFAQQTHFEALVPQRSGGGHTEFRILLGQNGAASDRGLTATDEPEMVAQLVRELTESVESAPKWKPSDIAILFRKRKHFDAYAAALRSFGIPVLIHQGSGLYDQPEVKAILAWLQLVSQPSDDMAAAEVIRGPLVNCSDDLLLKLSLLPGHCFWDRVLQAASGATPDFQGAAVPLAQVETERVTFAVSVFQALTKRAGIDTIDELLLATIELTHAEGVFAASEPGMQIHANLRKLVELARGMSTRNIAEYLSFISSDARGEGVASVGAEAADALKIMTIHASKGLEFPVVILPELADRITVRPDAVMTDGSDWFVGRKSMAVHDNSDSLFLPAWLLEQKLARSMAEERRVLYVAMTRCRDALYLSANAPPEPSPNSFYGWIEPMLSSLPVLVTPVSKPIDASVESPQEEGSDGSGPTADA